MRTPASEIDYDTPRRSSVSPATSCRYARVYAHAQRFRARGKTVVLGGPLANLLGDQCRPYCDVLFEGEAEYTWPRFLRVRRRPHADHYLERTRSTCPIRRRRALTCSAALSARDRAMHARLSLHLRVLRHHHHVWPEDALQADRAGAARGPGLARHGVGAGVLRRRQLHRPPRLRPGLLAALAAWNRSSRRPLSFYTQISIDIVRDEPLLRLLRDANFAAVFIGIESPRKASLAETRKTQNEKVDLVEAIHKIQSHNLFIWAGMIVGFDNDDAAIFDEQFDFLEKGKSRWPC